MVTPPKAMVRNPDGSGAMVAAKPQQSTECIACLHQLGPFAEKLRLENGGASATPCNTKFSLLV